MLKQALFTLSVMMLSWSAFAQIAPVPDVCNPGLQGSMICLMPQLYGPKGLLLDNPRHSAHFVRSSLSEEGGAPGLAPIAVAVGTELSLQNIASPASGVVFSLDRALGVVTRSSESFGPIWSERAETIGRHRIYLAGTYQFYQFSTLDDFDLKNIPAVYAHAEFPIAGQIPEFERDFITTTNRVDLKVHQFTLYGTFGLTDRIDVSASIPVLDVRLGVTSQAHIVRIAPPDPNGPGADPVTGEYHYFNAGDPVGSINNTFSSSRTSSGIGDVTFRVKGTVLKGERAGLALGVDVRTPTGDERNFLGAGAPGVKPFLAASYRARFSPHANIGFQWNGSSILAGNVASNTEGKLPNQFFYSFGVDAGLTKKLTAAVDLVGQRLSSATRLRRSTFVDPFGTAYPNVEQTTLIKEPYTLNDLALGAKYNPFGNLLLTGNVLLRLNKAGLRATAVPMIGVSYIF